MLLIKDDLNRINAKKISQRLKKRTSMVSLRHGFEVDINIEPNE
jgi:hypothetical protein